MGWCRPGVGSGRSWGLAANQVIEDVDFAVHNRGLGEIMAGGEQVIMSTGTLSSRVDDGLIVVERDQDGVWQVVQRLAHPLGSDAEFGHAFDSVGPIWWCGVKSVTQRSARLRLSERCRRPLALATIKEPSGPANDADVVVHDGLFAQGLTTGFDLIELSTGDLCTEDGACVCQAAGGAV